MILRLIVTLALLLASGSPAHARDSFDAWLANFRDTARGEGISERTLDAAFSGIEPIERVIELDRRQPEGRMTFADYADRVVTSDRIAQGKRLLAQHRALLGEVERRYGVPAEVIVALWGIESSYGQFKGRFPVVASLATLAWDGRRASLFERELLSALRILEEGHVDADGMYGSWAGAMGQSQFMPSTFLGYAVDYSGDGRRDIWTTLPDVFASMANYLSRAGWRSGYIWGREVRAPVSLRTDLIGLDHRDRLSSWQALGVRRADGSALPQVTIDASLVQPDGPGGASYLVYDNFRTVMVWNRSTYFALSVGMLADALGQ